MSSKAGLDAVLSFLTSLKRHNNREWFEAHRSQYESALADFEAFVGELVVSFGKIEHLGGVHPKSCIRRIYRDIRFSPNKTPYKTHMAAEIVAGGTKATRLPYYIHVAPKGGTIIAGGLYMASTPELTKFRQAIADDSRPFKKIIQAAEFRKHFGALEGESLKTTPKGFSKDHPDIDILRLTEIVAWKEVPDAAVKSRTFANQVVASFTALKPFLDYLNRTTGRTAGGDR